MTTAMMIAACTDDGRRHARRRPGASKPLARQASAGLAAAALGLAMLAGASHPSTALAAPPPSDVAPPAPDRLWGGCVLDLNTQNGVLQALGQTSGADFLAVYSLETNDGQQFNARTAAYTGPIICSAPDTGAKSYTEATPIPNADTGGGQRIDILTTEQSLIVRYAANGTREKRICRSAAGTTSCYQIRPGSSGCQLGQPVYDAIVAAIKKGKGIVPNSVGFVAVIAYSVQGTTAPGVCAAPGFEAVKSTSPSAVAGDILDTEEALIVRYKLIGGQRPNAIETRLRHTVAAKTDCFRLYQ